MRRQAAFALEAVPARPILKWAGGKGQLLPVFEKLYPSDLKSGNIDTYCEPFVGGGAVFLDIWNRFCPSHSVLADINPELVLFYRAVQNEPDAVICHLSRLAESYLGLDSEARARRFLEVREAFNASMPDWEHMDGGSISVDETRALRAAQIIFLNRTCFNGLFRVNRKGHFNVPHGRYRNPTILDEENIRAVSRALADAEILLCDFSFASEVAGPRVFVYFDPPYRPLSATSSFTSYSKHEFADDEQRRLADVFHKCHGKGARLMLSNSDPWAFAKDPFFEDLYAGSQYRIHRVSAKRAINSVASGRGKVGEIVVTNYVP